MTATHPTQYVPNDRLALSQGLNPYGTGAARKINFSNAFTIIEDLTNDSYTIGLASSSTPSTSFLVYTNQSNVYDDFDSRFRSGRLDVMNPGNTFPYSIIASAITAARNLTLPLLTADDTAVCEAFGQTLTNKVVNASNNTITDTSQATGDLMVNNGTKFVRRAKGTGLQVLRTNSGATDLEWATLDNERVGKSTASGNGSTTVFNIAHGVGSNPTYAFIVCSSLTNLFTYTTDSTNIVVTFSTAPTSGTNNVVIYWRVVA